MNNARRNSMPFRKKSLALSLLLGWVTCASVTFAAPQLDSVTIGFSSFSGFYGPLWLAVEEGVGKKYGVDLRAVYAGRVRPQQLLANKLGGGIFSKSEIKRPEDLKGKLIATGRPGALNDILVRYVMTRKWGLSPDRDVKLMPIGEPPLMLQALERGVVDATSLSVPASFLAKSKGFFELVDYDALGLTYPQHAVTTLRATIAKNPQMIESVLKTLIESVAIFKSNKQKSFSVWRKYMRGASEEFLDETYQHTIAAMESVPTPSVQVIASALDMISAHYPQ